MGEFNLMNFAGWLDQNVGKGRKVRDEQRDTEIASARDQRGQIELGGQQRQAMSQALQKFMQHNGDVSTFSQQNPKDAVWLPMIQNFLQGESTRAATDAGTASTKSATRRTDYLLPREAAGMDASRKAITSQTVGYDISNTRNRNEGAAEERDRFTRDINGLPVSTQGAAIAQPYQQMENQKEQQDQAGFLNLLQTAGQDPARMFSMPGVPQIDYQAAGKTMGYDIPYQPTSATPQAPGMATAQGIHQQLQQGAGRPQPTGQRPPSAPAQVSRPAPAPVATPPQGGIQQTQAAYEALQKWMQPRGSSPTAWSSSPVAASVNNINRGLGPEELATMTSDIGRGQTSMKLTPEDVQKAKQLINALLQAQRGY
jgi:hypothetical protein